MGQKLTQKPAKNGTILINLRAYPEEREAWRDASKAAEMTMAAWMRAVLNDGIKTGAKRGGKL